MARLPIIPAAFPLPAAPLRVLGPGIYHDPCLEVVDGDTVRFKGERVRLLGFDAPETYRPSCRTERILGERAAERLTALLESGYVRLEVSERRDLYGRPLGVLSVDWRNVGDTLIAEGLAVVWTGRRHDWSGD